VYVVTLLKVALRKFTARLAGIGIDLKQANESNKSEDGYIASVRTSVLTKRGTIAKTNLYVNRYLWLAYEEIREQETEIEGCWIAVFLSIQPW
jgi:hypothetical protein